jgi:hypothetical protein
VDDLISPKICAVSGDKSNAHSLYCAALSGGSCWSALPNASQTPGTVAGERGDDVHHAVRVAGEQVLE